VAREDAETISIVCGTVHEAIRSLNALSVMANALR
jgi:D-amino peptidase